MNSFCYLFFPKILFSNILLILFLFVFLILVQGELREKRQSGIFVSSSGGANANGNNTDLSSSNSMWKNTNGVVGANGTSSGKASGNGSTNVRSESSVMAGQNNANNFGNANAIGANSMTAGMSASNINGNNVSQSGAASGSATGKGNSQVIADNTGFNGNNATNVRGRAGATGNNYTSVDVSVGQVLNWGQVMYSLSAMSTAMGENNSQANLMLNGGSFFNPALSANAIMSGVNDKSGGNVYSHVAANGTGIGNNSQLNGEMVGGINSKTGGSRLVGAESLTNSGSKSNINSFANILLNGSGASNGGIWGNSSINPSGSVNGIVGAQGKSNGENKTVTVDDGIRGVNSNGVITGGVGRGNIEGSGNQNGEASSYVGANSGYPQSGLVVGSKGESKALNGTPSILSINDQGNVLNGTGMGANGTNNVYGKVTGQTSSVNGDTFMGLSQNGNSGNSSVVAKGGGAGSSSALTNANLNLPGVNGTVQSEKIQGSVDARGDKTNVYSISQLTNSNGAQSLFNNQKSDVQSKGVGQASSSNNAILKRKKREEEENLKKNFEESRKIRSAEENVYLRQLLENNGNEKIVEYL